MHLSRQSSKPKNLGKPIQNVYLASLQDAASIEGFLEQVPGAKPIERFIGKELLYFESDAMTDEQRLLLKAKSRANFRKEIRRSRVLILTIKGKSTLSLEEGLDVVRRSPLDREIGLIELIAVNPKMLLPRRGGKRGSEAMVHVYIQFKTVENACDMVNSVDAMKWQEWYVHSPQCDEHPVFYPDAGFDKDDYIWVSDQLGSVLGKKPSKVLKKKRRDEDCPPTLMDSNFEIESSASGGTSITPELIPSVPMIAPVGFQNMVMPTLYDPAQLNATLALQQLALAQAMQQQQQTFTQPVYVTTGLPSYPMSQPIILMNSPLSGVPVPGF